jgi:hypothetical protein
MPGSRALNSTWVNELRSRDIRQATSGLVAPLAMSCPDDPTGTISRKHLACAGHPFRIDLCDVLSIDGGRILSSAELAYELQEPLSTVDYHVGVLCRKGKLRLVNRLQVGGAVERFYCLIGHSAKDLLDRL